MPKLPPKPPVEADDLPKLAQVTFDRDEMHVALTSIGAIIAFSCVQNDETAQLAAYTSEHALNVVESVGYDVIEKLLHKLHAGHIAICPTAKNELEKTRANLQ